MCEELVVYHDFEPIVTQVIEEERPHLEDRDKYRQIQATFHSFHRKN